ncbi:helix-turn-helix transcriptional regulator [Agromyces intestinalis]|uniref:Helix-turn-helix transcriptional regulator n=1 Tax=Agromyces intestinalis TaxID=2592652 RepID=A0A5C1YCV1_9MICO|nr:metalloregulator ArsR/SmtB family transcription factor [Agromyces intestinalis]QEO13009.1 helix-turn-helix transcriptional regulator [Agromyces intestinalis]
MTDVIELPAIQPETCCTSMTSAPITPEEAAATASLFKALGDPTRVLLVSIVAAAEGREACVCDLTEPTGLSQPTVSHHLKILMDAGFLSRTRRGSWAYYALVPGSLERLAAALGE